jgi:hypothetical protein
VPDDGRVSSPALQKFAGTDFIERFLAEPQHSLRFDSQVDVVSQLDAAGAATRWLSSKVPASLTRWTPAKVKAALTGNAAVLGDIGASRVVPSALRKLFRPEHDRHYLVVCELHCDLPGLPSVTRDQVCQAGFVLRRRRLDIPDELATRAEQLTAARVAAEAALAQLESLADAAPPAQSSRTDEQVRVLMETNQRAARREALRAAGGFASFDALLDARRGDVDEKRDALPKLLAEAGVPREVQAWLSPDGAAPPRWVALSAQDQVADTTHRLHEQFFPLVPLVPDPRLATHDATGRTIYFGVVPTVLADHDPDGVAHLDDKSTYEIRCFVRRHDPARPRASGDPDCCGEAVWSEPTEPFRIAPPFDLVGTAQRPVTIQMPDLRDLAAQVAARPRGRLSPVKFLQPQHMSPSVSGMGASGGTLDGPAICFFSIPLITIVALFLLNLFLPIVVLIFNLWFLLALRFCIKPQIGLAAGLDAALAAVPPGVDVSANIAAAVAPSTALTAMTTRVRNALAQDTHIPAGQLPAPLPISDKALADLAQSYADAALLPDDPADAPHALGYTEALEYEPHRSAQWRRVAGGRG